MNQSGSDPIDHLDPFLDALASEAPAPGGGAVAGVCGALAAALAQMVANLTVGKKKYAGVEEEFRDALPRMRGLMRTLLDLARRDAAAFEAYMEAFRLPKGTDREKAARREAMRGAAAGAAEAPLEILEACRDLLPLVTLTADRGNRNLVSDAGIAALLITAAARSAAMNVKINLGSLPEEVASPLRERMDALLAPILAEAAAIADRVDAAL